MGEKEIELKEKKALKPTAGEGTRPGPLFIPAVDILEDPTGITIVADMPGVDGKNVDIDLKDNQLTITGRIDPVEGEKKSRSTRSFCTGTISANSPYRMIDQNKITAKMEDGVLRLILPKVEKMKPQKIKVLTA
jgi:HSP20 family protein